MIPHLIDSVPGKEGPDGLDSADNDDSFDKNLLFLM